ncbi:SpoIID/LytB domain-containing protein [Paenibacillus sp. NPDC056579]|uniref:SpoIID/LytB domain-containing protein n=1 Tax=Paenibacillus sp. NPDC056579 TaxID=3345871 RepID=UPI0036B2C471
MRRLRLSLGCIQPLVLSVCVFSSSLTAAAVWPAEQAYAAVPKMDKIRVALFIDTGKYSVNTSFATLSSAKGLEFKLAGAQGAGKTAFALADKAAAAVSLDGYRISLWEGVDAAQAKAIADKLTAVNEDPVIFQQAGTVMLFQVQLGPYASKEAAAAAMAKVSAMPAVSGLLKGSSPAVHGPLHLNAGVYATEAEAAQQAAAIRAAGLEAEVAYMDAAAGAPAYAVLAASASDATELATAKQQLAAVLPGAAQQPVGTTASYVLKRAQLDASGGSNSAIPHFMVGGSSAKLTVSSGEAAEPVTVKERSERAYRGVLEVTQSNGKLAVINEVPFEQYVASVISSELNKDWPLEALKAQAVAARTYALKQGLKYQIAHVSDSTVDQAYYGAGAEFPAALSAVQATAGEVLADKNGLISPLFYSNAGGKTAESTEVWGNKVDYLKSVPSPDDGAQKGKAVWYRIVLPNGNSGYIHSSYARDTGQKNAAGFPYYESTGTGVAVRPAPYVDNAANPAGFKVDIGDRFIVFGQEIESNAYSWIRGPFDGDKLKEKVNAVLAKPIAGALNQLEISKRGESGRVTEMKANGQVMKPANPDALRTVFNGLPSTRFEIEETGRYTILGADGTLRTQSSSSSPVTVAAGSEKPAPAPSELYIMNGDSKAWVADNESRFVFRGTGFGHGLGMSQWGARGYAELGYDYKKILQTYYVGVSIIKE